MLTRDENYAEVAVTVFYRIDNPRAYLFNAVDPVGGLTQATASALRQVVGSTDLEDILTSGREAARAQIQQQIQDIIARYQIGLQVTDTKLQMLNHHLKSKQLSMMLFKLEDYNRYMMQAEAYKNKVIPQAQGQQMRMMNEADARYEQIIFDAQAQIAGFNALLEQYRRDPDVLKNKMYLNTMKDLYSKVQKVFISNDGNMSVLPLQNMLQNRTIKLEDSL